MGPGMGPHLLWRDLKYGPPVCSWFTIVLYWVDKDSEVRAHTRRPEDPI